MIIELLLPSLIAGLFIAICSGVLGCFVVWRRMAFFSDALAHSALLGTALALLIQVHILYGIFAYGILVAILLARFDQFLEHSGDTLLAIIAQTSLAAGVILLPLTGQNIALESLLFGDILAIGWQDVLVTGIVSLIVLATLFVFYYPLLQIAIDEKLAAIEGIAVARFKCLLFCLMVALIAVAVQMVGVLLVGALLLIPAMIAKQFAHTPLSMMLIAPIAGSLALLFGLTLAWQLNIAAGPAIVLTATAFWLLSLLKRAP